MLIYSLFIRVLFSDSTFLAHKYKFESLYSSFNGRPFISAVRHALRNRDGSDLQEDNGDYR
jgi:hypothetical protein